MLKFVQKTLIVTVLGSSALLAALPANAAHVHHEEMAVQRLDEPTNVPEGQFAGSPAWARQVFTRGG